MSTIKELALRGYVAGQQRARYLIETREEGMSEATAQALLTLGSITVAGIVVGAIVAFVKMKTGSLGV